MSDQIPKLPTFDDYEPPEGYVLQERIDELERKLAEDQRDIGLMRENWIESENKLTKAKEEIANLRGYLERTQSELTENIKSVNFWKTVSTHQAEEIARMKPVVEAAVHWAHDQYPQTRLMLQENVRLYEQSAPEEDK